VKHTSVLGVLGSVLEAGYSSVPLIAELEALAFAQPKGLQQLSIEVCMPKRFIDLCSQTLKLFRSNAPRARTLRDDVHKLQHRRPSVSGPRESPSPLVSTSSSGVSPNIEVKSVDTNKVGPCSSLPIPLLLLPFFLIQIPPFAKELLRFSFLLLFLFPLLFP